MFRMFCFGASVLSVGGIAVSILYNPAKNMERQAVDRTHWLDLSDGRRLAYCLYGPENGKPVFALSGAGGTRLEFEANQIDPKEEIITANNVRLITIDRPGYGESAPQPTRTLLGFAKDLEELATSLKYDKFAVMGISSGGCYAMACARLLPPERLVGVALVSSDGPNMDPSARPEELTRSTAVKSTIFFVKYCPWLLTCSFGLLRALLFLAPSTFEKSIESNFLKNDLDLQLIRSLDLKKLLTNSKEAFRQGSGALIRDLKLQNVEPWGFRPADIRNPNVHIWHGEEDPIVPFAWGTKLASSIPGATGHFLPKHGHISVIKSEFSNILQTITEGL